MPHDPSETNAPLPPAGRRRLRGLALTGTAAAALLAAAGVAAFDARADRPASEPFGIARFQDTTPGADGKNCPEGRAAPTLLSVALQEPAAAADTTDLSVADVAERANPAVVTVVNRVASGGGLPGTLPTTDDETIPVGAGSGFIIDTDGRVVTNAHVVEGADELGVRFFDGSETTATVVGRDRFQDIAVIQLDLAEGQTVPATLAFGDSDAVRAGEDVIAIGSSLGEFANSVSTGIVSAVDRALPQLPNLIQHDAEIYQGNSGGPLLNLAGEVVGINTAGISDARSATVPARLAFAVESNAARQVVDELIANGEVRRAYLGIEGDPTTDGAVVAAVQPDTPAAAAGLQPGDRITAIDGQPIAGQSELQDALFDRDPGATATLTLDRAGSERQVDVTLAERPPESN